jgi:hypothetical protein
MIRVRNCDTPAIKDEIAELAWESRVCQTRSHAAAPRSRRSYDHRIREIVCETGNPRIFQRLRIPRSTMASWLSRGRPSVISLD